MSQKLGGIVCDNPKCTIFVDFAFKEAISRCVIIPMKRKWTYCSEKCAQLSQDYRMAIEAEENQE